MVLSFGSGTNCNTIKTPINAIKLSNIPVSNAWSEANEVAVLAKGSALNGFNVSEINPTRNPPKPAPRYIN